MGTAKDIWNRVNNDASYQDNGPSFDAYDVPRSRSQFRDELDDSPRGVPKSRTMPHVSDSAPPPTTKPAVEKKAAPIVDLFGSDPADSQTNGGDDDFDDFVSQRSQPSKPQASDPFNGQSKKNGSGGFANFDNAFGDFTKASNGNSNVKPPQPEVDLFSPATSAPSVNPVMPTPPFVQPSQPANVMAPPAPVAKAGLDDLLGDLSSPAPVATPQSSSVPMKPSGSMSTQPPMSQQSKAPVNVGSTWSGMGGSVDISLDSLSIGSNRNKAQNSTTMGQLQSKFRHKSSI